MVTCKDYAQFVKNKLKTKIKGMEKKASFGDYSSR